MRVALVRPALVDALLPDAGRARAPVLGPSAGPIQTPLGRPRRGQMHANRLARARGTRHDLKASSPARTALDAICTPSARTCTFSLCAVIDAASPVVPVLVGGVALVRNRRAHRWRPRPVADQIADPVPAYRARGDVTAVMALIGGHAPSTRPRPPLRPRTDGRCAPAYRAGWPIGGAAAEA
jgi:hypothetical protein